jgi:hypothetical protein
VLYALGEMILRHLGATVAGGSLIGVAVAVAAGSIALSRSSHRLGGSVHSSARSSR